MTEKRFKVKQNDTLYFVIDTIENKLLWTFEFKENEFASLACFIGLIDKLNELNNENDVLKQQLKTKHVINKQYEKLQELKEENQYLRELLDIGTTNAKDIVDVLNIQQKDNNELRQHIKKLEKQIYLIHMSSMFSTVKSFKGDVSKRYYYSEKTDRLYDTANNYGQYDKILEKKEIAMLLNEYETLLKERDENEH